MRDVYLLEGSCFARCDESINQIRPAFLGTLKFYPEVVAGLGLGLATWQACWSCSSMRKGGFRDKHPKCTPLCCRLGLLLTTTRNVGRRSTIASSLAGVYEQGK